MTFSRILVDIDATATDHPALSQALELAKRSGALVTIVDVIPEVPKLARRFLSPTLEDELVDHRRAQLSAIADNITVVDTRTVLLRGRPAAAVIAEVRRSEQELVVRSHVRDLTKGGQRFGSVDMELLRQCPCPVWLIGPAPAPRPRRVLAAVHADTEEASEEALNRRIVELALALREIEDAELTVIEAWNLFGEDLLRARLPPDELQQGLDNTHDSVLKRVEALVASFGDRARGVRVEVVKGQAEVAIPAYVEAQGVDLVVMGTVARAGVSGLLIGNTAEHVLQKLRGSVLAVKPPRFVSPAAAPDADPWVARPSR